MPYVTACKMKVLIQLMSLRNMHLLTEERFEQKNLDKSKVYKTNYWKQQSVCQSSPTTTSYLIINLFSI